MYLKLYLCIVAQLQLENALIKMFSHTLSLSPEMKQNYTVTSQLKFMLNVKICVLITWSYKSNGGVFVVLGLKFQVSNENKLLFSFLELVQRNLSSFGQ